MTELEKKLRILIPNQPNNDYLTNMIVEELKNRGHEIYFLNEKEEEPKKEYDAIMMQQNQKIIIEKDKRIEYEIMKGKEIAEKHPEARIIIYGYANKTIREVEHNIETIKELFGKEITYWLMYQPLNQDAFNKYLTKEAINSLEELCKEKKINKRTNNSLING